MKNLMIIFSVLLGMSTASVAGACDSKNIEPQLVRMFSVKGKIQKWISVRRDTYGADKAFPITVYATNRISTSKIQFRNNVYNLKDATFCRTDNWSVIIYHPEGTLNVKRYYGEMGDAIIHMDQVGGAFKFKLRPSAVVAK